MRATFAPSGDMHIQIAGDICVARTICAAFCRDEAVSATVMPIVIVTPGGSEPGVRITLDYPRVAFGARSLADLINALAERLRIGLLQTEYAVLSPDATVVDSLVGEPA